MGKTVISPRYNVVSLRLTDEEKLTLVKLAAKRMSSVGDVVRENLQPLLAPVVKPLTDLHAERS
jgi:hypothetical protein